MSEGELEYLAELASHARRIVEIGSYKGRSFRALVDNMPDGGLAVAVDIWIHGGEAEFQRNFCDVLGSRAKVLHFDSGTAAAMIAKEGYKLDLVFIDDGHEYVEVKRDIEVWRPLLAEHGVLCGHDYGHPGWPGVRQAVDELVPKFRVIEMIWTTECSPRN